MNSWVLAVDASGSQTSAALFHAGTRRIFECSGISEESHDEELALGVERLLQSGAVAAAELGLLVVGAGPGSFTGLRIGFALMKGLSLSYQIPLISMSSFAAAAWEFRDCGRPIAVVGDARRDEIYFAEYRFDGSQLQEIVSPRIVARADCGPLIAGKLVVLRDLPRTAFGNEVREASRLAAGLCELGAQQSSSASFRIEALADLAPNYLRAVSAKTIAERSAKVAGAQQS